MYELKRYSMNEYEQMTWKIGTEQLDIADLNLISFLNLTKMEIGKKIFDLTEQDRREVDNAMMHKIMLFCFSNDALGFEPEVYWCGDKGFSTHISGRNGFLPVDILGFAEVLRKNDIELRKNYLGRLMPMDRFIHPSDDPNVAILLGEKFYGKVVNVEDLVSHIKDLDKAISAVYEKGEIKGCYRGKDEYTYNLRACQFLGTAPARAEHIIDCAISALAE